MIPRRAKSRPGPRSRERLVVVAALIESDGKILACQRRKNDAFGLKWEFPGGKMQREENPADALARELKEELGVEAAIGDEIYRTRHRYAELAREIELIFFGARADKGKMRNLAFEQMRWVTLGELAGLDFLPADREFVAMLARRVMGGA
jgi:8-oxo-dGTP diphosphatase